MNAPPHREALERLRTTFRPDRIACAMLVSGFHVAAALWMHGEIADLGIETRPELPRPKRAMLVTAFMSEDDSSAPRFATLSAADFGLPTAIVLPLPQLPEIQPIASDSFERAREMTTSDDVKNAERLQGLYVGQIKARVHRLLEGIRVGSSSSAGKCVVYVVQNERGQVLDVMSDECERDTYWRREIENAIRRASPLPLPPEGLGMGSYLTLDLSTLY